MDKVLNQTEIDAMVRAARGATSSAEPTITDWNVRNAQQIGREQLNSINLLHETFARNLTYSIGAYLRIVFEVALVSAEHLSYHEFLHRLPESTYIASFQIAPVGVPGVLQMDLSIAFPMIESLLGGEGRGSVLSRDLTEIEHQILESVVGVVLRELQNTWQAIALEFSFDQKQPASQAHRLMPPDEKNLCLSFEITMPETRGTMNVAVPAVVSNALLRKITADCSYQRPKARGDSRDRLQNVLLKAAFPLELTIPDSLVPLHKLSALAPGTLLVLPRTADGTAILASGGVDLFRGTISRVGDQRAVRLAKRLEPAGPGKEPS